MWLLLSGCVLLYSDKKLMADYAADLRSKTGMKSLFGRKNIKKDNTEGKVRTRTTDWQTSLTLSGCASWLMCFHFA